MKKKSIIGLLLIGTLSLGSLGLIGCDETVDSKNETAQEKLLQQANDQVGMPNITNFYEKKMAKKILELRDDSNLICYAYVQNQMGGKFIFLGKCVGYGLPYGTEYTNPERVTSGGHELPQADPNGLFPSSGTSATWLMMVNDKGEQKPMYCEPNTVVVQDKLDKRLVETWSLTPDY